MEMRSLSLCLEAPGSCAAQFIESGAAHGCVMPAAPATRNVRSVASRGQGAAGAETPDKAGKPSRTGNGRIGDLEGRSERTLALTSVFDHDRSPAPAEADNCCPMNWPWPRIRPSGRKGRPP